MVWIAVATIGSAIIGGAAARTASSRAADSNNKATEAASTATADRLEFDKGIYEDGRAGRDWASNNAKQIATWQGEDRTKYNALQDEQVIRGRRYQAAEDGMLQEAQSYNTEGKREELAGRAMADVQQGFASAQGTAQRNQSRMGINPSSGAALAMDNQMQIALALGLAGAGTRARSDATTQGYARRMDALGLGKGLIGNQATQAGLQLNSGNSSASNGIMSLNPGMQAGAAMSQGYGNAANGFRNVAELQSRNFYNAQGYGAGVGQNVGGMLMGLANLGIGGIKPGGG